MIFESPFDLGDWVLVDDSDLPMRVTAIAWREARPLVELSWVFEGRIHEEWVSPFRLKAAG